MRVQPDLCRGEASLQRRDATARVLDGHRSGGIDDVDAVGAVGLHEPGLLEQLVRLDHVGHHQEPDDFHPELLRELHVLLGDIRLGAVGGDASHLRTCVGCPVEVLLHPDAWQHGGASVWVTGSYDPALNLTYWGLGNAGPDYNGDQRPGDNLYTASVVALDLDTGKLKWHYQFTPHDRYDYDSVQVPVLADITFQGAPLKAMLWANRNGNFYVLNRETGKFMLGKPFVKVNWMSGFDANGRPIQTVQPPGMPTYPAVQGGSNWYSPSYSPRTKLMYVSSWQDQGMLFGGVPVEYKEGGRGFGGGNLAPFVPTPGAPTRGIPGAPGVPNLRRGPVNNWTDAAGHGAVLAIDPSTGEPKWRFMMYDVTDTGIVTTASDLLFTGGREGYLQALDARTGTLLWKQNLGAQMLNNPMTYAVNGKQYVAAMGGLTLFVFALP